MSSLPKAEAKVLQLKFFEGRTEREIAAHVGMAKTTVHRLQDRGLLRLRAGLDGEKWTTCHHLKAYPKNREPSRVHIHSALREIIERCLKLRHPGCDYLFHVEGKPLNYCTIQTNYRRTQIRTGIPYTGTHCLRHGMATLARRVGGMGLDSAVAMTGHKDLKLADHYSKIDGEVQKETSLKVLEHIQKLHAQEQASALPANVLLLRRVK